MCVCVCYLLLLHHQPCDLQPFETLERHLPRQHLPQYLRDRRAQILQCESSRTATIWVLVTDTGVQTHHTVGVRVAGLGHGQALNDFRCHPGKRARHRHVGGVGEKLRCPKITNLKSSRREKRERNAKPHVCFKSANITNLQHFVCRQYHCKDRTD